MNNISDQFNNENIVVIVLDSCRWDVFSDSRTPYLDSCGKIIKASANASFTYPAHLAMYQGYFPSANNGTPYYDRKTKPLIFIEYQGSHKKGWMNFPSSTADIIEGFRGLGYYTLGIGSAGWFLKPQLSTPFEKFIKTPFSVSKQIDIFRSSLKDVSNPFFSFINIGDTHCPYGLSGYSDLAKIEDLIHDGLGFDQLYEAQLKACEKVDFEIKRLFDYLGTLKRNTVVVFTSDHGECFGEDGMIGHGVFHEKIAEVPLGIFVIESKANNRIQPTSASLRLADT